MNYKNVYEQIAEYLDNKLGREATDIELDKFMRELEQFEPDYDAQLKDDDIDFMHEEEMNK